MQQDLVPIFKIRELCLQQLNPTLFKKEYTIIHNSALAAQDYVMSGMFQEYKPQLGLGFKRLPGYIAIHKKYHLPYNPDNTTQINPGLVMDLAHAYQEDITNGIIDKQGNIRKPDALAQSEVLAVYHNSATYGTPSIALRLLIPSQVKHILTHPACQHTR